MVSALPIWRSELNLGYAFTAHRTMLLRRQHVGPLLVQKALYPEGPEVCHSIILYPPGGIAAGDSLDIAIDLAAGSKVLLTTPAAGKWYRSLGAKAQQEVSINIAKDALLEWLPQENIIFDGAQAELSMQVDLAVGAAYLGWEITCLGRTAAAERYTHGKLRQVTAIHREGKLLWREQCALQGGDPLLGSVTGFNGRPVTGTFIAAGKEVSSELLALCRKVETVESSGDRCGVTMLPNLLLVRYLGYSTERARQYFENIWALVRPLYADRAACPPRIWKT